MDVRNFVEGEAALDDDENEELADEYDEGGPAEGAKPANHLNDSSEEEDEDDDEAAAREVYPARDLRFHLFANTSTGSRGFHCR